MPRQLLGTAIAANTITTTQLQTTVVNQISAGGGPRVSSLIYPGNDTAGNTVGGQTVYINGSGFETNNAIYINGNAVPSKSFISASNLSFTTPALSAGIYPVYVINTDTGATAIFVPGYISSAEPAWVTSAGSLSTSQDELGTWTYNLSATGDAPITYALAAGSSLPGGISLAANGLISGTISSPTGNVTTYTFSVVATDAQNQDSTRQFSITTSAGEGVLFANNVLLIHADGTNNQNNHTFLDSSNNNFTITRNGNATQGSFSPFSQTGWSGYFDGNGDYLALPSNDSAFNCGTESFTLEFWFYDNGTSALYPSIFSSTDWTPGVGGVSIRYNNSGSANKFYVAKYAGNSTPNGGSGINELMLTSSTYPSNVWHHVAFVRNGNNFRIYVNGQIAAETTSTVSIDWNLNGAGPKIGGGNWDGANSYIKGYISNLRLLKGTALYTSAFTPPTAPLAPIANTSLLTLQSNRLIDEGPNNFTITRSGDVSIQSFSPFTPGILSSNGYSVYFDGNDTVSYNPLTSLSSIAGGPVTIEAWVYYRGNPNTPYEDIFIVDGKGMLINGGKLRFYGLSSTTASTNLTQNTWVHLAVVRESNANLKGYVDGSEVFSTTASANFGGSANATAYIGSWAGGTEYFTGYISNLRVSNSARYTANFTPSTIPFTSDANTALLACQSPTLIDNSNNNFTLTPSGDLRPSKFNPFGQTYTEQAYSTANVGGSIFFDGSGDRLTLPSSNNLVFGTGDFCVETWAYFNANPASMMLFTNIADADTQFAFRVDASGYPKVQGWLTNFAISSATVVANQWYHLVACRVSNTLSIFINGVRTATATVSNNFSSTNAFTIGGPSNDFSGFMSGLRVIKGSSPYNPTRTFISVPTNPVTSIANTQLLLNSTNAQIFDQTAKNVLETVGDAKVSTAQYKYGTGSIAFDGTGDYLLTTPTQDLEFGSGDFTIEFWWYPTSTTRQGIIHGSFGTDWSYGIDYNGTGANKIGIWASSNGSSWNLINADPSGNGIGTTTPTQNAWNHIAYVRNGTTWMLFVNGNRDLNLTGISGSIVNRATSRKAIGSWWSTGSMSQTSGYIDDLRITKGYARYTSNFTPPTSALKDK